MRTRLWLVPMVIVACLAAAGRASAADPPTTPAVYPIQEQFVDADGVLIYTMSVGRGAPLVILHGGPGASHDYFLPYLLPLARHNRLVFIDERGSGRSEKLEDATQLHRREHGRRTSRRCGRRSGLGKINLLGHSFGGVLAQAYAFKYQANLSHLVLCSTFHSTKALNEVFVQMKAAMPRGAAQPHRHDRSRGAVRPRQGLREEPLHQRLHDRRLGRGLLPVPLPEPPRPELRPGRERQHGVGPLPRDVGLARRVRHRRQPRRRSSTRDRLPDAQGAHADHRGRPRRVRPVARPRRCTPSSRARSWWSCRRAAT